MSRRNRDQRRGPNQGAQAAPPKHPQPPQAQAQATAAPAPAHRFNDDLLLKKEDQDWARTQFAEIYHVLHHPELIEEFEKYEGRALKAKSWVHFIGLLAVLLAALALLGSALTPLLHERPGVPAWVATALVGAEVGGIVGVLIAAGGMWMAGQKKAWLEARMMAEVLRLWHFQSLICRGGEIESSCEKGNPTEPAAYRAGRERQFRAFLHEWEGTPGSHATQLIDDPEAGYQMLHEKSTPYRPHSPVLEKVFEAYKALRFRHQANFATYKLQKHTDRPFRILKWPSAVLQARVEGLATFCLLGSLACSLVIVIGYAKHIELAHHIGWPVAIITFLILTVAARAVQDGLAAPEELQRYNDYAGKTRYLEHRFDASGDQAEKLRLMAEMERAALEELKGFLRAHSEARFVL